MIWAIPAAATAIGAISGAIQKGDQEEARKQDLLLQAEMQRLSPWLANQPNIEVTKVTADPLKSGLEGAQVGMLGAQGLQDVGVLSKPLTEQDKFLKMLREREMGQEAVSGYTLPSSYDASDSKRWLVG